MFFPNRASIASLGESALDTLSEAEAEGLLATPGNNGTEVHLGPHHIIIQSWNPVPHVVVVGENKLSRALTKQFDLFGWSTNVVDNAEFDVKPWVGAFDTPRRSNVRCGWFDTIELDEPTTPRMLHGDAL